MTSSTLRRPAPLDAFADSAPARTLTITLVGGCVGIDVLAKVVTVVRGRRWCLETLDADLAAGLVHVTVQVDDDGAGLLAGQLGRVVGVGSVQVGGPER